MDDQVGSLRPGKHADLVLLRTDAVNLSGARRDPVASVVTAAHPGNVDTVLVAGTVVKRDGRLLTPHTSATTAAHHAADRLSASLREFGDPAR
ncbi:amidohydrolase family protein [Sphaerisporangium sp. NPDC005288]|uniref:amidohydrolase family protein n=1 Tax=Sphaerisporangium sp. NPDC005288 TaxID=3155114 RepID=UPI0033B0B743